MGWVRYVGSGAFFFAFARIGAPRDILEAPCRDSVTRTCSASRTTTTAALGQANYFVLWSFSTLCFGESSVLFCCMTALAADNTEPSLPRRFLLRLLWPAETIEVAPVQQ
jgi:hypothetical protein